jgi:hypothetical protein
MFRKPWLALLFVGMTLMSVAALVGTEQDKGTLASAAESASGPHSDVAPTAPSHFVAAPAAEEPAPDTTAFADDEELIDGAEGTDPTPPDDQSADTASADSGEDERASDSAPAG